VTKKCEEHDRGVESGDYATLPKHDRLLELGGQSEWTVSCSAVTTMVSTVCDINLRNVMLTLDLKSVPCASNTV
jgi:hypothetical protein